MYYFYHTSTLGCQCDSWLFTWPKDGMDGPLRNWGITQVTVKLINVIDNIIDPI